MVKARVENEERDAAIEIMLDKGEDDWGLVNGKKLPGLAEEDIDGSVTYLVK